MEKHRHSHTTAPSVLRTRLPSGRFAPFAPPLRVGLSRPMAAQKWLAYGQASTKARQTAPVPTPPPAPTSSTAATERPSKAVWQEKAGKSTSCAQLEHLRGLKGRKVERQEGGREPLQRSMHWSRARAARIAPYDTEGVSQGVSLPPTPENASAGVLCGWYVRTDSQGVGVGPSELYACKM